MSELCYCCWYSWTPLSLAGDTNATNPTAPPLTQVGRQAIGTTTTVCWCFSRRHRSLTHSLNRADGGGVAPSSVGPSVRPSVRPSVQPFIRSFIRSPRIVAYRPLLLLCTQDGCISCRWLLLPSSAAFCYATAAAAASTRCFCWWGCCRNRRCYLEVTTLTHNLFPKQTQKRFRTLPCAGQTLPYRLL